MKNKVKHMIENNRVELLLLTDYNKDIKSKVAKGLKLLNNIKNSKLSKQARISAYQKLLEKKDILNPMNYCLSRDDTWYIMLGEKLDAEARLYRFCLRILQVQSLDIPARSVIGISY